MKERLFSHPIKAPDLLHTIKNNWILLKWHWKARKLYVSDDGESQKMWKWWNYHTHCIILDYNSSHNIYGSDLCHVGWFSSWNFINNNFVINSMITFNSLLLDKINLFFYEGINRMYVAYDSLRQLWWTDLFTSSSYFLICIFLSLYKLNYVDFLLDSCQILN